ncbi:MAG: (2Fe-2S) ferredoxin domain-containing protein [Bacteroidales bacterium]|nr:(2Fe-2S) ferredoxin domain-containing protein [Bacteroidales bacterium]
MERINDLNSFKELQKKIKADKISLNNEKPLIIKIAMATCGLASGAGNIKEYFEKELAKRNIVAQVISTGCMGYCFAEPTVEVIKNGDEGTIFGFVDTAKVDDIIDNYIVNNKAIEGVIEKNYINVNNL